MPWKETEKMDGKKEFVLKAMDRQLVFTQLCREYGIGYENDTSGGNGFWRKATRALRKKAGGRKATAKR